MRTNDIGMKVWPSSGTHSGVNGFKINYCIYDNENFQRDNKINMARSG